MIFEVFRVEVTVLKVMAMEILIKTIESIREKIKRGWK